MAVHWTDYPERVETFGELLAILETLDRHEMESGFTAQDFQKECSRPAAYTVDFEDQQRKFHPRLDRMPGLERLLDRFNIDGYPALTQREARELRRRITMSINRDGENLNKMRFIEIADSLDAAECKPKPATLPAPQPNNSSQASEHHPSRGNGTIIFDEGAVVLEARTSAFRLVVAIDELLAFARARYWEVLNPRRDIDEDEWHELVNLEGRVVGLLAIVADGRIQFQSQPNSRSSQSRMLYTAGTGLPYFFCGQGRSINRDDRWEPKMLALRAAVQTVVQEEVSGRNDVQRQTRMSSHHSIEGNMPMQIPATSQVNTCPVSVEPPLLYVEAAMRALPSVLNNAPHPQGFDNPARRRGAEYCILRQGLESASHNRDAAEWAIHRHAEAGRLEAAPSLTSTPGVLTSGGWTVKPVTNHTFDRERSLMWATAALWDWWDAINNGQIPLEGMSRNANTMALTDGNQSVEPQASFTLDDLRDLLRFQREQREHNEWYRASSRTITTPTELWRRNVECAWRAVTPSRLTLEQAVMLPVYHDLLEAASAMGKIVLDEPTLLHLVGRVALRHNHKLEVMWPLFLEEFGRLMGVSSDRTDSSENPGEESKGGRPKLGEGPKATTQEIALRNVYDLIRAERQEGWGPKTLMCHFRDDKEFKIRVKEAGQKWGERVFKNALAWIQDNPDQKTQSGNVS